MAPSVSNVSVRTPDGSEKSLGSYAGQVLLIVNVASRCGFTKQYAGLQSLQDTFGPRGLQVVEGRPQPRVILDQRRDLAVDLGLQAGLRAPGLLLCLCHHQEAVNLKQKVLLVPQDGVPALR